MESYGISKEELDESLKRIDARLETEGVNEEAEAARNRERKVEIYDDLCHIETELRTLHIAQPTMGFALLYRERRGYFEDDEHGFGRLLVALKRMKEPGYVRALRMGDLIPDEEADEAMLSKDVYIEDKLEYYLMVEGAIEYGEDETEKKTMKLLEKRMGLSSGSMERSLKSLNSLAIPSTNSSMECTSAPSET